MIAIHKLANLGANLFSELLLFSHFLRTSDIVEVAEVAAWALTLVFQLINTMIG